jgi:hypothetical protein
MQTNEIYNILKQFNEEKLSEWLYERIRRINPAMRTKGASRAENCIV